MIKTGFIARGADKPWQGQRCCSGRRAAPSQGSWKRWLPSSALSWGAGGPGSGRASPRSCRAAATATTPAPAPACRCCQTGTANSCQGSVLTEFHTNCSVSRWHSRITQPSGSRRSRWFLRRCWAQAQSGWQLQGAKDSTWFKSSVFRASLKFGVGEERPRYSHLTSCTPVDWWGVSYSYWRFAPKTLTFLYCLPHRGAENTLRSQKVPLFSC